MEEGGSGQRSCGEKEEGGSTLSLKPSSLADRRLLPPS